MNIEKWIEENTRKEEYYETEIIELSEIKRLLKTHAIVPREPSDDILEKLLTMNSVKARYNAMIKAAENEQ